MKAIVDKSETPAIIEAHSPIKEPEGLLQHEMIVLVSIAENREGRVNGVAYLTVKEELERLKYNNLPLNIGLEGFLEKGLAEPSKEQDSN